MTRLAFSTHRYTALSAVQRDQVRYHTGLNGPALGYTWSEHVGGQMFGCLRQALCELWAANLVEVDTHRLFARRGHRVVITMRGYRLLCEWNEVARNGARCDATGAAPAA